jgi:DNA-binding NtrC family response regulator
VLRVPPLRDRLSDLPELVDHILTATCARFGIKRKTIDARTLELLAAYDWKRNNVRELRNVVERMLIAADGDVIGPEQVPAEIVEGAPATRPAGEARTFLERKAEAERQIVLAALERNEWHITRTAHDLGLSDHASLLKIMRRHGIASR